MPTIHFHLSTTNDVADVVTYLLSHYGGTITIDQDPFDDVATRVAADRTAVETGPSIVDTILASEIDNRAEREARHHARYVDNDRKYDRVLVVPCPMCRAVATDPCVRPNGAEYPRPYFHKARYADWQAHSITPPVPVQSGRPDWMPTVVTLDEV